MTLDDPQGGFLLKARQPPDGWRLRMACALAAFSASQMAVQRGNEEEVERQVGEHGSEQSDLPSPRRGGEACP
jgi:hypothetical protein